MKNVRNIFPSLALVAAFTAALLVALAPAATPAGQRLAATVGGTVGSYRNDGNVVAKAADGDLSTYFDGPTADGCLVVLDLGSTQTIGSIAYAPRSGYAGRMVGGSVQASNDAKFATGVATLATIAVAPASGVLTTVKVPSPVAARYVRYVSPAGGYGNIAELQAFAAATPAVATPAAATAVATTGPVASPGMLVGSPGTRAAAWTVAARNAVCFDVTPYVDVEADDCSWSTPGATSVMDPTTGVYGSPDGLVATTLVTVLYDLPGSYPVACTVKHADGTTTVYAATVTVTAEARIRRYFAATGNAAAKGDSPDDPLSYSALPAFAAAGGYRLSCSGTVPLTVAPLPACVHVGPNTEIEGLADATGALPTVQIPAGLPGFYVGATSGDVVLRNLAFDAPVNALGYADKGTTAVDSEGPDTLVFGCEVRHLYKGFGQGGHGDLSVVGCRQTVKRGIYGQIAVSMPLSGRFACLFNDFRGGTTGEAIERVDWFCTVWAVARNAFAQDLAAWGGSPKPGFDGRCGSGVETDNVHADCQSSMNMSDPVAGVAVKPLAYVLVRGNTFDISNAKLATITDDINVRHGAAHVTVRGNTPSGAFAKFVDGYAGLTAITIGTNAGKGS